MLSVHLMGVNVLKVHSDLLLVIFFLLSCAQEFNIISNRSVQYVNAVNAVNVMLLRTIKTVKTDSSHTSYMSLQMQYKSIPRVPR